MCGIVGFFDCRLNLSNDKKIAVAVEMTHKLGHRGPDAANVWMDPSTGFVLGHTRLSILDLSTAGSQPMISASGRYAMVFNGEIYNHLAIRAQLEASNMRVWQGHSDTETLLVGIEEWGLDEMLRRSVGMFALAVWDTQTHVLQLARDRLGEKPLYYFLQAGNLSFSSELKALTHIPGINFTVDRDSLCLLLKHGYIPAPHTIYSGISKLLPGQIMKIRLGSSGFAMPEFNAYWDLQDVRAAGKANPFKGSDNQAIEILEALIKESVRGQMLSDVPLGAFLSGGVDSSTIVALMQAESVHPIKTFSIGFEEQAYNELAHARAVAEYLKTDHAELVVTAEDALELIQHLPEIYDEPFADISQIPTLLVSRLAKTRVTVSLSGDGGDELFCGYNRYLWGERVWRCASWLPLSIRKPIGMLVRKVRVEQWDQLLRSINVMLPKRLRFKTIGNKLHRLAVALSAVNGKAFYEALTAKWLHPENVVLGANRIPARASHAGPDNTLLVQDMMAMDTLSYLPDDILAKVDRAAMAFSLETRVPFLDQRVVAFAWRLPENMKIRHGEGKWVLKKLLDRYVPRELMARPKMGFDVPLDGWLRGPLKDWAEQLLSPERLKREGYFNELAIQKMWQEHLAGQSNWHGQLWCVLMFQAWLEKNKL